MIRRWVITTVLGVAASLAAWPAGSPPALAEAGPAAPDLTKTNLFLAAGDYRRALESCQKAISDMPTVRAYVHLTYVYHAIDGYLEQLSQEERWTAVEQLYLNLAYRRVRRTIQLFGGLFMIVGVVDLVIIELFPAYALKLFGAVMAGPSAFLIKLHSPAVHLLIGYGFLWLRPWAWGLSLAYAGFGIVSEVMNQAAFGFQYVRTGFIFTTACFALYLIWRRQWFVDQEVITSARPSTSEGAP